MNESSARDFTNVTELLRELHWLHARHRITYKVSTITYRTRNCQQFRMRYVIVVDSSNFVSYSMPCMQPVLFAQ